MPGTSMAYSAVEPRKIRLRDDALEQAAFRAPRRTRFRPHADRDGVALPQRAGSLARRNDGAVGERARDQVACCPRDLAGQQVGLADEIGDEQVGGLVIDLARRPELDDAPAIHHADEIAHRQRLLLVVRDQHEGDAELALQVLQLDLHVGAQLLVERGERLVEQQHGRLVDQRPRQRDTLLLAAGQFVDPRPPIARRAAPSPAPRRRGGRSRLRAVADAPAAAHRRRCRPRRGGETARIAGTPC